jgi:hypothetical protein
LRQRDASGISDVTQTSAAEMCSTIQSSAASALSRTRTILTFDIPGGRMGRLLGDEQWVPEWQDVDHVGKSDATRPL